MNTTQHAAKKLNLSIGVMACVITFISSSAFASEPISQKADVNATLQPTQLASPQQQQNTAAATAQTNKPRYCPLAKELERQNMSWEIGKVWKSYGESFVSKIDGFVGAQWVGIKVGKIICLYKGENNNDFPVALEQVKSRIILEPSGTHWSALVNNHKFCKSGNVFDCPYYVQVEVPITHIYKEIEYQTQDPNNINNSDF